MCAEENPVHHGVPSRPDVRETRVRAGCVPSTLPALSPVSHATGRAQRRPPGGHAGSYTQPSSPGNREASQLPPRTQWWGDPLGTHP